jgi:hypothetical protein
MSDLVGINKYLILAIEQPGRGDDATYRYKGNFSLSQHYNEHVVGNLQAVTHLILARRDNILRLKRKKKTTY